MKNKKKKGFTIVELVIVIAVIAVLAAVLIPTFSSVVDRANESAALQNVQNAYIEALANALGQNLEGKTFPGGDFEFEFKDSTGQNAEITKYPTGYDKDKYPAEIKDGVVKIGSTDESGTGGSGDNNTGTEGTTNTIDPSDPLYADKTAVKEMNATLATGSPANFADVVDLLQAAGYSVDSGIYPTDSSNYTFYWDESVNMIMLVKDEDSTVVFPENQTCECYWALAYTPYYVGYTDVDKVFEFGGTITLTDENTEDGKLTIDGSDFSSKIAYINSNATFDLNGKTLALDSVDTFNIFGNTTIKNGTIKISGLNCVIRNATDSSSGVTGQLTLDNISFEVDNGLNLQVAETVSFDGTDISVTAVKAQCPATYTVTTYSDYIKISNDPANDAINEAKEVFTPFSSYFASNDIEDTTDIPPELVVDIPGEVLAITVESYSVVSFKYRASNGYTVTREKVNGSETWTAEAPST